MQVLRFMGSFCSYNICMVFDFWFSMRFSLYCFVLASLGLYACARSVKVLDATMNHSPKKQTHRNNFSIENALTVEECISIYLMYRFRFGLDRENLYYRSPTHRETSWKEDTQRSKRKEEEKLHRRQRWKPSTKCNRQHKLSVVVHVYASRYTESAYIRILQYRNCKRTERCCQPAKNSMEKSTVGVGGSKWKRNNKRITFFVCSRIYQIDLRFVHTHIQMRIHAHTHILYIQAVHVVYIVYAQHRHSL